MSIVSRRAVLMGLTCSLAAPAVLAQSPAVPTLSDMADRARSLDQLHALVVNRNGEEVFAEAFRGPSLSRPANVKSVSKTLVATLTGIAIDLGLIENPDLRIAPVLDRAFDDQREALAVGHLLSMRAGLESTSGPNYGRWISSNNWVDYALTRPLVDRPGGQFIYSTGSWHILGAVLARATGMSLLEMARNWLGTPLQVDFPAWVRDPQGLYLGGNEMAMTPHGLARFGEMILNGGRYGERQIVSTDWIERSWQPRARSPWSGDLYGYGWFLTRANGHDAAYARGYGGQLLVVVPALGLSLAITSDPGRPARSGGYFSDLRQLVDLTVTAVENA